MNITMDKTIGYIGHIKCNPRPVDREPLAEIILKVLERGATNGFYPKNYK